MPESCRAYRHALLVGAPRPDGDDHAAGCPDCCRFRDVELGTADAIRAGRPTWTASSSLRERVAIALEAERQAAGRSMPARGASRRSRRRVLMIAGGVLAAAAAAALVVAVRAGRADGQQLAHEMAEALVDDHLKYARRADRLQLAATSPPALETFFEQELQLAAKLPVLGDARLVGGRRCKLRGRPAALAFYDAARADHPAGDPISLFVFESRGEDWSRMKEIPGLRGKRTCRHHERGVGLVIWEERGLVYAMAGALEADELGRLLSLPHP